MKINKRNPRHLAALLLFSFNVVIAALLRPFRSVNKQKVVILYGHKLTGNLLALYRYWQLGGDDDINMVYLTMDRQYYEQLIQVGVHAVLATRPVKCIRLLMQGDAVISSHGLHVMAWMVGRSNLRFFDVWHGIPFKGFDSDDFRLQHRFDASWVSSPVLAEMYVKRFGFDPARVEVTGYARTDQLVQPPYDMTTARAHFQLPPAGKIVLFAPTWQQDDSGRSIYPFGAAEDLFLDALDTLAEHNDATVVIRAHLNSHEASGSTRRRIVYRSFADHPNTEALLLACDVLVCDWSSIAFDWLLLQRPTVFLDVPAPFAKGFSLGPEYRFDAIASSMDDLLRLVEQALQGATIPATRLAAVRDDVYGKYADGQASARCLRRLKAQLFSGESSRSPSS